MASQPAERCAALRCAACECSAGPATATTARSLAARAARGQRDAATVISRFLGREGTGPEDGDAEGVTTAQKCVHLQFKFAPTFQKHSTKKIERILSNIEAHAPGKVQWLAPGRPGVRRRATFAEESGGSVAPWERGLPWSHHGVDPLPRYSAVTTTRAARLGHDTNHHDSTKDS